MKAAGLQGDPSSEIIEILDDDTDAFGDRAPSHTLHDSGGRRWAGPVAAVVLAGAIGYGVASTGSSDDTPKVASATTAVPRTTLATPSTRPVPTRTLPPAPPVPYYAAEPPRQYKVLFANIQTNQGQVFYGGDGYQLWATDGATATTGTWFSITSQAGAGPIFGPNAYRIVTDQHEVVISHMDGGVSAAQFSAGDTVSVTVSSHGYTDDELIRLVESLTVDNGRVGFADPSMVAEFQLISTVSPYLAAGGASIEQVNYGSVNDSADYFNISVGLPASVGDSDVIPDRETALGFLLGDQARFSVDGHPAVAGAVADGGLYAIASWMVDDHFITVGGPLPVEQLIDIARTVHEVPSAEWEGMKFQAAKNLSDANSYHAVNEGSSEYQPVSFGTDSSGATWTINVAVRIVGARRELDWQWRQSGIATTPGDTAQITTFVDDDRTYVLADLPRAIATAAELQVVRAGLDPVVVPFQDIGAEYDRTFAAYAFNEAGPYTAQVVGADGSVLATWPSP